MHITICGEFYPENLTFLNISVTVTNPVGKS